MSDRKCGYDFEKLRDRSAEEEQTNDEKNVVGSDEDMVDALDEKLPNDCKSTLAAARAVIDLSHVSVEDALILKRSAVVDVKKRSVPRIGRK